MAERMLISIHGVETEGEWQQKIDPSFEGIDGFAYRKYRYGKFPFWEVARTSSRDEEIENFAAFYDDLKKENPRSVSIIAHSFGTYIVGSTLVRFPSVYIDSLVLCGSILATDYDWNALRTNGRIKRVLNERAGDDWVVNKFRNAVLRAAVPYSGPSGVDGFVSTSTALRERVNPQFKHSDHFILVEHCNRYWRPFLFGNEEFTELSWRYVEGDAEAQNLFNEKYQDMVRQLVKGLFPDKSDDAVAERAETILDAIALDGVRGIYSAHELAVAKVGKLWIARQKAQKR